MAVYGVPRNERRTLTGPVSRVVGPVGVIATGDASANAVAATVTFDGTNAVGKGTATASAVTATVTFAAANPTTTIGATASSVTATGTFAATNPTTTLSANPPSVTATLTFAATNPTIAIGSLANPVTATLTFAANNPTTKLTANPPSIFAAITALATNPTTKLSANPPSVTATLTFAATNAVGQTVVTLFATSVSSNGRYLLDQNGAPYFIQGTSPQALPVQLTETDMDTYFAGQGGDVNSMQVHLMLGDRFPYGRSDFTNISGDPPFSTMSTLSGPNTNYWARVDAMFDKAAAAGITLWVSPCEHISMGPTVSGMTDAQCVTFGEFIGNRYKTRTGVIWSFGNDWQPTEQGATEAKYRKVLEGIRNSGDTHMVTVWGWYTDSVSMDLVDESGYTAWETLCDVSLAYSYTMPYYQVEKGYLRNGNTGDPRPVFGGEFNYENEHLNPQFGQANTTNLTLRRSNWWVVTWGGCGTFFTANPIEFFSTGWASVLNTTATQEFARVAGIMTALDGWQDLVPDTGHAFVTAGYGTHSTSETVDPLDNNFVTSAVTPDGRLGVVYLSNWSSSGTATIDVAGQINTVQTITRIDPTNGATTTDSAPYTTPGNNAAGDPDWLLVFVGLAGVDATANPVTATLTFAGNNPTVTVSSAASSVTATGTFAATNPTVTRLSNAAAVTATLTFAGNNPAVSGTATATSVTATGTFAAANPTPTVSSSASSVTATFTVAANNATGQTTAAGTANSVTATLSFAGNNPTVTVSSAASSVTATVTAAATNPTVTRLSNANPVTATLTFAASNPTTKLTANPPSIFAALTITGNNATGQVNAAGTANPVTATLTFAAANPTVTRLSNAGAITAGVTANANNATTKLTASIVAVYAAILVEAFNASSIRLGLRASTTSVRIASATVAATLTSSTGTDSITAATATEDIT